MFIHLITPAILFHQAHSPDPPQDCCLLRSLADPLTFRPGAPGQDNLELLLAAASTTDCKVPRAGSEPPRAQVSLGNRTASSYDQQLPLGCGSSFCTAYILGSRCGSPVPLRFNSEGWLHYWLCLNKLTSQISASRKKKKKLICNGKCLLSVRGPL